VRDLHIGSRDAQICLLRRYSVIWNRGFIVDLAALQVTQPVNIGTAGRSRLTPISTAACFRQADARRASPPRSTTRFECPRFFSARYKTRLSRAATKTIGRAGAWSIGGKPAYGSRIGRQMAFHGKASRGLMSSRLIRGQTVRFHAQNQIVRAFFKGIGFGPSRYRNSHIGDFFGQDGFCPPHSIHRLGREARPMLAKQDCVAVPLVDNATRISRCGWV